MWIILDLIVIAIIMLFVAISAKHGFVKTVIEVAGFVAVIMITFTISTPLAGTTYDKIIEPPIISAVSDEGQESNSKAVEKVWEKLPEFVVSAAEDVGVTAEKLDKDISTNMHEGVEKAVKDSSQSLIRPVVVKILGLIYSVVIMLVLSFVVSILAKFVNSLFSFSVVGKLNRALGGVIGAVKGIVAAIFFCMVVSLIISFTENGFLIFTPENVNNSYVFKFFTEIIPFN